MEENCFKRRGFFDDVDLGDDWGDTPDKWDEDERQDAEKEQNKEDSLDCYDGIDNR